jgi:RNA polymerase sigma-70 factor (sigma-E family)
MMATVMSLDGRGDIPAVSDLDRLYRDEASRLLGMITVFLGDRAEAEDVVQEAFLRVQRSWDRITDHSRAAAYLRSTAFNLARSGLRRRLRRPALDELLLEGPSAEAGYVLREDQRDVLAALGELPARQRACVVLRFYGDAGIDEIAATLGISNNSVKTHLRRAMQALEAKLEGRQ